MATLIFNDDELEEVFKKVTRWKQKKRTEMTARERYEYKAIKAMRKDIRRENTIDWILSLLVVTSAIALVFGFLTIALVILLRLLPML